MKKIFILSMLISFAMICSCQKQDAVAEQQLAQRKVELDAREDALIEREKVADEREKALDKREKALTENEKSRANVQTISPDAQSQDVIRDEAEAKAERDRRIQEFRARIPDPSQLDSTKVEKDRMTRDPRAQRQGAQQESQSHKQYKLQQAQKWQISGAAASPAVEATSPTPSPAAEATSPTPSSAVDDTFSVPSATPQ
jgi:hypothetical protein